LLWVVRRKPMRWGGRERRENAGSYEWQDAKGSGTGVGTGPREIGLEGGRKLRRTDFQPWRTERTRPAITSKP